MKKIISIIIAVFAITQMSFAQQPTTPVNNPIVYVTPNGSTDNNYHYGLLSFTNAITPNQLMNNVNNSIYSGDITVCLAGGDYYTELKFWCVPSIIQSISLYGGYDPATYYPNVLVLRDLEQYETRFHASHDPAIWLEAVGYSHPNGWNTCVIDGITMVSDYDVNVNALRLVGGDHIVSQCKFEAFFTSNDLVWLETNGNNVTFTSCLFAKNLSRSIIALCSNVDLINVTIADNSLYDCLFESFGSNMYTYNIYNSIIYGNDRMNLLLYNTGDYINIDYSILQSAESWMNDLGNNQFTDPLFTYNTNEPYSCNYIYSPAVAAGNPQFIMLNPYYSFITASIMDWDVVNHNRYWDTQRTTTDIGAYQNTYANGSYFYNEYGPVVERRSIQQKEDLARTISLWCDSKTIFVNNISESGGSLTIYNMAGQIVYESPLQMGQNTIPVLLNAGIYVAKVQSHEGGEMLSKTIFIQ